MEITALVELGRWLKGEHYRFITVTPESHRRVNARAENSEANSLRDIFGWSRRFKPEILGAAGMKLLAGAGTLKEHDGRYKSAVRFSSYGDSLFVHSAYPCDGPSSVFFGPDTYRFLRSIECYAAQNRRPLRVIDIGTGSGAAGVRLAQIFPEAAMTLSDVNPEALVFARANALLNGCAHVATVESDVLRDVDDCFDLIVSNPPYLVDAKDRLYRHGGGTLGFDLSLRILDESLARLSESGHLLLYTGSAIVDGRDFFREKAEERLARYGRPFTYEELDPDVFGEELDSPPYKRADRLAVILLKVDGRQH